MDAVTCKHCGEPLEAADVFMDGRIWWRHASPPRTMHCIVNGELADTTAEPS